MSDNWNIITCGPSHTGLTNGDLIPGSRTVAINRAIKLADTIKVDFWAMMDDPDILGLYGNLCHYVPDQVQIWTKHGFRDKYIKKDHKGTVEAFDAIIAAACEVHGRYDLISVKEDGLMIDTKRCCGALAYRGAPTFFAVLNILIGMGAKRVRIFGLDMDGQEIGRDPSKEQDPKYLAWRWGYEKMLWRSALEGLAERGIHVEWIKQEEPRCAPVSLESHLASIGRLGSQSSLAPSQAQSAEAPA